MTTFEQEIKDRLKQAQTNEKLKAATDDFINASIESRYSYNYTWLGRPIIQYPQDIVAVQELILNIKPDLIIETGIAHGGSLVLSASMLALNEYIDATSTGNIVDPLKPKGKVIGIDIDIRPHNREAIKNHPLFNRITMIESSSVDPNTIKLVTELAKGSKKIMVFLDSNHTHKHVLEELTAYSGLVSEGSYCVVFDTVVENISKELSFGRPWGPGASPMTAVDEFLSSTEEFEIDTNMDAKLQISVAPRGYLKRIK